MAKKDKAVEAPAETTETKKDKAYLDGKVNSVHEGHAAYIKEVFGVDVDPAFIFAVYSTRVAYRKTSEQYQGAKSARAKAKEDAAAAKEAAKAAKAKEREEAKAAKDAEKAKADAAEAKKSKGKGKQTSAEASAEADAANEGEAKAAAKKATPAKGKKKPF